MCLGPVITCTFYGLSNFKSMFSGGQILESDRGLGLINLLLLLLLLLLFKLLLFKLF